VWGCKAYVLKPKADRRKGWEDKAQIGYFTGYDTSDTIGWEIYLPVSDTFETTVHVLFDERPPQRSHDYFRELDEAASVFTGVEAKSVSDFEHLIRSHHIDDEDLLLYVTKRVMPRKAYLVGYRAQITSGREEIKDSTPIHIADIERMTIATTLMMNKSTKASEKSAGSRNDTNNRKRDIIATGDLDSQPLKLQRGSGKSKKGDRRNNNSKQKK
jgi:hypothetical protein